MVRKEATSGLTSFHAGLWKCWFKGGRNKTFILGVTTKDKLTIKPGPQWWE